MILLNASGIILGLLVIWGLCVFLGSGLLEDPLAGDSPLHVAYATWLNSQWPEIPHWFPLHGAGVSLLHGYPILPHYLAIGLSRIASLSIDQAYRALSLGGFVLQAFGIFLLGRYVLRRTAIGILASMFFLISPISWTWMSNWGFFSQHIGFVFLPPLLLAFHAAFANLLQDGARWKRRLWLVALTGMLVLAALCHILIASAAVSMLFLFIVTATLAAPREARSLILRKGLRLLAFAGVLSLLLGAGYLVPFFEYGQYANREGLNVLSPHLIPQVPALEALGLRSVDPSQILTRMQFSLIVTVFAVPGTIAAVAKRRSDGARFSPELSFAVVAIASILFALTPAFTTIVHSISSFLSRLMSFRSALIAAMVLIPLIAGFGAWWLADRALVMTSAVWRRKAHNQPRSKTSALLGRVATSLLSFGIAGIALLPITGIVGEDERVRYFGPRRIDLRDLWDRRAADPCALSTASDADGGFPLCNLPIAREKLNIAEFLIACSQLEADGSSVPALCQSNRPSEEDVADFISACEHNRGVEDPAIACLAVNDSLFGQLMPEHWSSLSLDAPSSESEQHRLLSNLIIRDRWTRMDLSPNLGGLAQDLAVNLGISQLPAYTFQLSLNHLMWGYQLGVFYTQEEYSQQAIADLSDWYGVQYVLLNSQMDDSTRFPTSDWSVIHHNDEIVLLESVEERQPASRLEKPTLLVIGDTSGSVYYDLFRMANEGLAPYDEFLFVDGSRGIDEYTQDELSAFDILLLHGYHYRDATRAWTLLGEYVRDGGSLFIDTGWQYKIPHWEFEQAPDVLPMDRLTWTSYGRDNAYSINADAIDSQIEANEFAPLVWEDHAWGVSGGEIGDVRDWAVPVLTSHGKPLLLAGEYGQGRVVWSGMNLISHINAYGNDQEKAFLRDLILWLAEGIETREWGAPEILRDVPDEIRFTISETSSKLTWLLWRESYYPNWHASWSSQEGQQPVPVYRVGPGLMLLPLRPTATTAVLTLSWEPDAWARAGILGSVLGFAGLVALLLDGLLLKGEGFTWLKIAFLVRTPRPFLGEGPNIEWAERKREELVTGFAGPQSAIADADVTASGSDDLGSSSIAQKGPGSGFDPLSRADPASGTPEEAAEESLLRSWLEKTGHAEDAWAEKLLRRRRSGKRGRGEE